MPTKYERRTKDNLIERIRELEVDKDRLLEQLVAGEELYISRGIEIVQLEAKLRAVECAECEKTLLDCECE
jgi:hypothetical protein